MVFGGRSLPVFISTWELFLLFCPVHLQRGRARVPLVGAWSPDRVTPLQSSTQEPEGSLLRGQAAGDEQVLTHTNKSVWEISIENACLQNAPLFLDRSTARQKSGQWKIRRGSNMDSLQRAIGIAQAQRKTELQRGKVTVLQELHCIMLQTWEGI